MLACTALVGCTSDDIDVPGGNEQQGEKVQAYISISVDTSTTSSRGETGGDTDGSSEHSGHENKGTTAENTIKSVLMIFAHQGANSDDGIVDKNASLTASSTASLYNSGKNYQVESTGNYDALVVINPVAGLLSAIKDDMTPRAAYNAVLNYKYTPTETANAGAMTTYTADGFMMANQKPVTINVTSANNSPETAATGEINVERAIAKITFREKAADQTAGTGANVYPVTINKSVFKSVTEMGWYVEGTNTTGTTTSAKWKYDIFNKANDGAYYVRVKSGINPNDLGQVLAKDYDKLFHGIYTMGTADQTHTGYVGNKSITEEIFTLVAADKLPAQIVFAKGEATTAETETYYVKLEKYALTNLSKEIYAVRHKTADFSTITPLGQLGASEYLVDPNSVAKNAETIGDDWTAGATYFFNPLKAVMDEANNMKSSTTTFTYFQDLNSLTDDATQAVTGGNTSGATGVTGAAHTGASEIGQFMSYCFENAVKDEKQVNALVTGIVFAGQIYTDAACQNAVDVMYKYKGIYYRELRALLANNTDDANLKDLTDLSTDEAAGNITGLEVYKGGKCFYYANEIKHYDNGDATKRGIMEFAIMRNNIYSLAINTISTIGSATVEPSISASAEDEGAYITMTAKILPWIVRFNNINF